MCGTKHSWLSRLSCYTHRAGALMRGVELLEGKACCQRGQRKKDLPTPHTRTFMICTSASTPSMGMAL